MRYWYWQRMKMDGGGGEEIWRDQAIKSQQQLLKSRLTSFFIFILFLLSCTFFPDNNFANAGQHIFILSLYGRLTFLAFTYCHLAVISLLSFCYLLVFFPYQNNWELWQCQHQHICFDILQYWWSWLSGRKLKLERVNGWNIQANFIEWEPTYV